MRRILKNAILITVLFLAGTIVFAAGQYEGGAQYVGKEACQRCHSDVYDEFIKSGHAYKLNKVVNGQPPKYPYTELPELPEGVTWDDVSYVIGGYNWKARFIGKDGFIITGKEGDTEYLNQYNFANPVVGNKAGWVKYHPGEKRPYNCGPCHTTGYSSWPEDARQDGLPGLIGTWAEPGITCERCHGPGSLHTESPHGVRMEINRDSEQCGECHIRGSIEAVNASGGFIQHHEQYEELFQSKHVVLDCNICHDPHLGVIQLRQEGKPTTRTECQNCHFAQAKLQTPVHAAMKVACIDCHMPRVSKSAVGNIKKFTGDLRTHLMAIDPTQIEQITPDGKTALSQLGLDFSCRNCHVSGGKASPKTDAELINRAYNYHARPATL